MSQRARFRRRGPDVVLLANSYERVRPLVDELEAAEVSTEVRSRDDAGPILAARCPPAATVVEAPAGDEEAALTLLRRLRRRHPRLATILLVECSSERLAVQAIKAGVTDYVRSTEPALETARSVLGTLGRNVAAEGRPSGSQQEDRPDLRFVGRSRATRRILRRVRDVAPTDSTVLISGETGTGKELIARIIHLQSRRRKKPFVAVNCAAVPDGLVESEFFGHERGAFTGAVAERTGAFERANHGTLVLDEVSDMSPRAQAKLLRAIESREIERLGGAETIPVDVRLIACTNQPLDRQVSEGEFRADLYYRLQVVSIDIPPLRERKEDLLDLTRHCLKRLQRRLRRSTNGIDPEAFSYFLRHDWPGNVRELQNLLESVIVTRKPERIKVRDLPEEFREGLEDSESLPRDEKERLIAALVASKGNKSLAARKLQCSRTTLYRRLARHDLDGDFIVRGQEAT